MSFLDGLFGNEPTREERESVRNDKRKTRRIKGERDTGHIADGKAAGRLSIRVTNDPEKPSVADNKRPKYWPGQRITEDVKFSGNESRKGSCGW